MHGVLVGGSGGYHVVGTPGVAACHDVPVVPNLPTMLRASMASACST
jgi:hypothetical protein